MQVLVTSYLAGGDTTIALLMTCASASMETTLASDRGGRRLVVCDDAGIDRIAALTDRIGLPG